MKSGSDFVLVNIEASVSVTTFTDEIQVFARNINVLNVGMVCFFGNDGLKV